MAATTVAITIPSTSLATTPKPHTVYHISLQLPLRSFTIQKRYSDFATLQSSMRSQAGAVPPNPLPPKSFFSSTIHNPTLVESRRAGLELYLQAVNKSVDSRWRDTPAWRAFLDLPSNLSAKSSASTTLQGVSDRIGVPGASDPAVWLDIHRELKTVLREARLHVATRDQKDTVSVSHEEAASAKKALVRAGTLIASLDSGLKGKMEAWGAEMLGEGEVHRRRDLIASARKEKDDMERLLHIMVKKDQLDQVMESKEYLCTAGLVGTSPVKSGGRVLGKETERTMKLDNGEVLQLQKRMMDDQNMEIEAIGDIIRRQRELAVQINEELAVQNNILDLLDEDVTRTEGKIIIARKRVEKINK